MFQVPTVIYDAKGEAWAYQYGSMYSDRRGVLRHRDSLTRKAFGLTFRR